MWHLWGTVSSKIWTSPTKHSCGDYLTKLFALVAHTWWKYLCMCMYPSHWDFRKYLFVTIKNVWVFQTNKMKNQNLKRIEYLVADANIHATESRAKQRLSWALTRLLRATVREQSAVVSSTSWASVQFTDLFCSSSRCLWSSHIWTLWIWLFKVLSIKLFFLLLKTRNFLCYSKNLKYAWKVLDDYHFINHLSCHLQTMNIK